MWTFFRLAIFPIECKWFHLFLFFFVGSQAFEPDSFQPVTGDALIPVDPFQEANLRLANPFRIFVLMKNDESRPTFNELLRSQPGSLHTTSDCRPILKNFLRTSLNMPFRMVDKLLSEYKLLYGSTEKICSEAFTDAFFFCPIKLFADIISTSLGSEIYFSVRSTVDSSSFPASNELDEQLLVALGHFVASG